MVVLSDFAERALKRITPMYENSEFIQELFNGISFDDVRAYFKTLREQSFIPAVDWAIETQEHKYSLEPRPDLSLEARRARLGIRAAVHRPLNPKILEQAIADNYGIGVYLYENDPGFIWLCANYMTEESFKGIIEFLNVEKPAHLSMKILFGIEEHAGGKIGGAEPKVYAGVAQAFIGTAKIEPVQPTNELIRARTAVGQTVLGDMKILPAAVKGAVAFARAGVGLNIGGEVTIACQKTLIPHSPNLPIIYPPDSPIVIPPDNPADPIVNPEYKPPAESETYFYFLENPVSQIAIVDKAIARGVLDFIPPPDEPEPQNYYFVENPIVQFAIADRAIARGAEDFITPIDDVDSLSFNTVKLFFDFPISRHRRVRGVALPNARDNLTEKEIQAVGQYAVDNKLITNTAGELASAVTRAALKTREVTRIF